MSQNSRQNKTDKRAAVIPSPRMPKGRLGTIAGAIFRVTALFGMACLFGAGLVTVIDVGLRFVGGAIPGAVDLVQLLILATAFTAIPFAFFRDGHVSVDLVTQAFPDRVQAFLAVLTALAALGLMALILWYGWGAAQMQMMFGDVSQNLRIPMIWYWAPLLAGSGLSILACLSALWAAVVSFLFPSTGLHRG